MFSFKSALLSGVVLASFATAALGADLPTKKTSEAAPAATPSCTSVESFFATDCPLTYYGITAYGAIDMGVGYELHGAPLNNSIISGVEELVQKNSNRSLFLATPSGLTQSFVGLKAKEQFAPSWYFISDLSFGFDPYTLSVANGPRSYLQNNGVPLNLQTSNADSSRAGQFYNGAGYVGVSNAVYGTLTVGRQNSLSLDGVIEYDPMGTSYAFSVIGWSGLTAGAGDTEDARVSSAVKYREAIGNFRIGALAQIGGYDMNNGAQGEYEGQVGADFNLGAYGTLSADAVLSFDQGAVSSSPLSAAQNLAHPGTLAATISDDTGLMLLGKWTYDKFKLSGGYEAIRFQNPSHPQLSNFTDIAGITVVASDISNTAYTNPRIQQVFWIGARYAFTSTVDAGAAYYHYFQSSYYTTFCANSSHPQCQGTLDAVSFNVDWRFAKKFDTYAGMMFSQVNNGLASGYLHAQNLAPTVGVRFRF